MIYSNFQQEQPNSLELIKAPLFSAIQPIMCPFNSDFIVCLSNENIYIGYIPTNTWIPVTNHTNNSKFYELLNK